MTLSLNTLTNRLIALGMDPALANQFNGTLDFGSATVVITPATTDGADNGSVAINGGGADSTTRGGSVDVYGNEHATQAGNVLISSGVITASGVVITAAAATSSAGIKFNNATGTQWSIDSSGNLVQGAQGNSLTLTTAQTSVQLSAASGLTAAGTTITDALQLTSIYNNVTTAGANTGVKLWNPLVGTTLIVKNSGANDLKLYPANASGVFNAIAAGGSTTLTTAGKQIATCHYVATNLWMVTVTSSAT